MSLKSSRRWPDAYSTPPGRPSQVSPAGSVVWYALAVISTLIFFWGVFAVASLSPSGTRASAPTSPDTFAYSERCAPYSRTPGSAAAPAWPALAHAARLLRLPGAVRGHRHPRHPRRRRGAAVRLDFWHGAFSSATRCSSMCSAPASSSALRSSCAPTRRPPTTRPLRRTPHKRPATSRRLGVPGVAVLPRRSRASCWKRCGSRPTLPSFEVWSPFGWRRRPADCTTWACPAQPPTSMRHVALWWIHGVAAVTFVAAIPFTKGAAHAGRARRESPGRTSDPAPGSQNSPRMPRPQRSGTRRLGRLHRGHLVGLDACTRCGKCHEACPATRRGYRRSSPRDLVLDLDSRIEPAQASRPDRPGRSRADTLWSCTQCMACVEICPVGIEHVPIINLLRRGLSSTASSSEGLQTRASRQ